MKRTFAVLAVAFAAACGSSSDTFSCNNSTTMACITYSISGATFTNKACSQGTLSASCSTTGIIGHCTVPNVNSLFACPSGATCSTMLYIYTGGDTAAGQAQCTTLGGTWSTS
jgi:hypothetical protein